MRRRPFWLRRLLPAFAALLALNLATLAAWTLPHGYRQRNAQAQLQAARKELAGVRSSTARLRERAAAIRSNLADAQRFYAKHAGDRTSELIPTLEAVETMARAPGLEPGARSLARSDVAGTRLEQVKVTLPLQGSYGQLVRFLRDVETSPRFLTIDSISMRTTEGGATLNVVLSTYLTAPGRAPSRGRRAQG